MNKKQETDVTVARVVFLGYNQEKTCITKEQNYFDEWAHANNSQILCSIAGGIIGATAL